MKAGVHFVLLLIFALSIPACHNTKHDIDILTRSADSLLVFWYQATSETSLKEDSILYVRSKEHRSLVRQLLIALSSDTLLPDDPAVFENYFSSADCFEKNYFLHKRYMLYSISKMRQLKHLKSDLEEERIIPDAASAHLQVERESASFFLKEKQLLKDAYEKCKHLMQEFERDALKIYHRVKGTYPSFYRDSIASLP